MHILMKFLKIKLILFFHLFNLLYSLNEEPSFDCINSWKTKNFLQDTSKVINIQASVFINNQPSDYIEIFIDKYNERLKINYSNQIFILDKFKSIRIFKDTNQLYIDNPDSSLYNMIFSIFTDFTSKDFYKSSIKIINDKTKDYEYVFNNYYNFNQINLIYNNDCSNMRYINLVLGETNIYIDDIYFRTIQNDSLFQFNDKYFEFDLRNEN